MKMPVATSENFKSDGRTMTTTYDLGTKEDGSKIEVEVFSSHSKDRKSYASTVIRGTVSNDPIGFRVKTFDLFGDSLSFRQEPVARYNRDKLQQFHWDTIKAVEEALEWDTNEKLTLLFQPVPELAAV